MQHHRRVASAVKNSEKNMNDMDQKIRECACIRIANIFSLPVELVSMENEFGKDLHASTYSGVFKENEYDKIENDIYDVSDRKIYKEISGGRLTINTVASYCEHMVRCYKVKPKDVCRILDISVERDQ